MGIKLLALAGLLAASFSAQAAPIPFDFTAPVSINDGAARVMGHNWLEPDFTIHGDGQTSFTVQSTAVPEPGTLALIALGLMGWLRVIRLKRARSSS